MNNKKFPPNKILIKIKTDDDFKNSRSQSNPCLIPLSSQSPCLSPIQIFNCLSPNNKNSNKFTSNLLSPIIKKPNIFELNLNSNAFISIKDLDADLKSLLPLSTLKLNERFFKIKSKTTITTKKELTALTKTHGKSINWKMIKEINEKESVISKLEAHHRYSQSTNDFLSARTYAKQYVTNYKKPNVLEKSKSIGICPNSSSVMSEEIFNQFMRHFYQNKVVRSPSLLKYFDCKNIELITNSIGKFIVNETLSSGGQMQASCEYLENVHRHLQITQQDYDTFKGLFMISMRENGFAENEAQVYFKRIENFRPFIVKKIGFEDVNFQKNLSFQNYLKKIHENFQENGFLNDFFSEMNEENAMNFHKKLFNSICNTPIGINLCHKRKELMKEVQKNECLNWRQCFEIKNIYLNNMLDRKTVSFHENFEVFNQNLHHLHKLILNEPNDYQHDHQNTSIDTQLLVSLLCHSLSNHKDLKKIFGSWTITKMQNHCKYMVDYLINPNKNVYKLCDMAPAHSGSFITGNEFNNVLNSLEMNLIQMKCKKDDIMKFVADFERTRYSISREKTFGEKIGDVDNAVDYFIEILYVYMFGCNETKQFFLNSELDYVKYKQKLFFSRILNNEIDSIDLVDLKAIHSKMGIKAKHFEIFLKFSNESLNDAKLNPIYIQVILEKVRGLMPYICDLSE